MSQEPNPKELVSLALVPIRSCENSGNGRHLGIVPRPASSQDHMEGGGWMEEIVNNLHFTGRKPVDPGDGIHGQAGVVQELNSSDQLSGTDNRVYVISLHLAIYQLAR